MDISKLNDWEQLMTDDSLESNGELYRKRRKIVENFKIENSLIEEIEKEIISHLMSNSKKYVVIADAQNIGNSIVETQLGLKDLMLTGKPIKQYENARFSLVHTGDYMRKRLKEKQSSQKGAMFGEAKGEALKNDENLLLKINEGLFPNEHWDVAIGNHLDFLWSISESDLKQLLDKGLDADDVRDMLGLDFSEYHKDNLLLYFTYSDSSNHHRPSIINGGDFAPFTPAPGDESTGYTINLKNGDVGVREIVRKPIEQLSDILIEFRTLGVLANDPAKGYLEDYS